MKSIKGQIDSTKIIKSVSRKMFAGVVLGTRVAPDNKKKKYTRKEKHRGRSAW